MCGSRLFSNPVTLDSLPLCVYRITSYVLGFGTSTSLHIIMCKCVYHHNYRITSYVHVQPVTKKQAVACPPQLFIADTLNTVNPAAADCHIRVCITNKLLYIRTYIYIYIYIATKIYLSNK